MCLLCQNSILPAEVLVCSVRGCGSAFHITCAEERLGFSSAKPLKCPQHVRICFCQNLNLFVKNFGFSRFFFLLSIHLKDMAIFIHSITAFPCEFGQGCSFKQGFSFHLFLDRSYKLTFFSVNASVDCFWFFNQSIDNFYEFNNVVMLLN